MKWFAYFVFERVKASCPLDCLFNSHDYFVSQMQDYDPRLKNHWQFDAKIFKYKVDHKTENCQNKFIKKCETTSVRSLLCLKWVLETELAAK